jgi:hypothetical protein
MKIRYAIISLTIILLSACQPKKQPGDDVKAITIKYTELSRETMFRIRCDSFDQYFPKPHVMNLVSKPAIDTLMKALGNMKITDNDKEPDVRGKIYITHTNNTIDTVCLGVTVLKYKQLTYETPERLLMMIQQ